jgi:hypothetical protein
MWEMFGQGRLAQDRVLEDLKRIEEATQASDAAAKATQAAHDPARPDARLPLPVQGENRRLAPLVPPLLAELRPLWNTTAWSPGDLELARGTMRLCARLGAPPVAFGADAAANQRSLALLMGWFRDYVATPGGLAAMIFTFDDGPFRGLPVPEGADVEVTAKQPFGAAYELHVGRLAAGEERSVVRVVGSGRALWSRVLSRGPDGVLGEATLRGQEPTALGPYGWTLHLTADGESLPLYVAPDGSFLFYFHSW